MFSKDLKQLLDEKYLEYNKSEFFIETDPIQIPKCFEEKEDIEIAGFLAASLAWGQRPTIIKKCKELMQLMDYAPHDFVMQAEDQDYERFCNFKHRTFNSYDCVYFLKSLANIYRHHGGLETVFTRAYQKHQDMFEVLKEWYSVFHLFTCRGKSTATYRERGEGFSSEESKYVFALDGETRRRSGFRPVERNSNLCPIDPA